MSDEIGSPVGSRELAVEYRRNRKVVYEIPDVHRHAEGLLTLDRGVPIYHADHAACFMYPQWLRPKGHYVYIVWGLDEEGEQEEEVLYIGMSSKILFRLAQHSIDSPWWDMADHIDIYEYATREAALEAEGVLINSYGPVYNTHYVTTYRAPTKAEIAQAKADGVPPLVGSRNPTAKRPRPPRSIAEAGEE